MKKGYIAAIVIIVAIVFLFAGGCSSYNGMVDADQAVQKQWGQVENQYQRRYDLIPNLVNTVQGYAQHESSTLETVTNARAGLTQAYNDANPSQGQQPFSPDQPVEKDAAANAMDVMRRQDALKGALDIYVNAVREAYPDLKANENFNKLQDELAGTENRIAFERRAYNEAVQVYNVKVLRFPGRLFAGMFGFQERPMYKAEVEAQKAPKVQF